MVNTSIVRKKNKVALHWNNTLSEKKLANIIPGLNWTFINKVALQINRPFPFCNRWDDSSKLFICQLCFCTELMAEVHCAYQAD